MEDLACEIGFSVQGFGFPFPITSFGGFLEVSGSVGRDKRAVS